MGVIGENRKNNVNIQGNLKKNGFDIWRHSFTAISKKTGESKQFFIEYSILNPALNPKTISFDKPCFFMIKAGCWGSEGKQLHKFFPIEKVVISKRKLCMHVDNFILTDNEIAGSIEVAFSTIRKHPEFLSSQGTMSWRLKVEKKISLEPKKLKSIPQCYWNITGAKTIYGGSILLDGEEFTVLPQKSFGYADKICGHDLAEPFFWLSSCNLSSVISGNYLSSTCFAVCGTTCSGKVRAVQVLFFHQNQYYSYSHSNSFFFSSSKIRYDFSENAEICHWAVTAENNKSLIDIEIFCKKEDMLKMKYISSRGNTAFENFWAGGNGFGEIRLYKKVNKALEIVEQARIDNCGCEYGSN